MLSNVQFDGFGLGTSFDPRFSTDQGSINFPSSPLFSFYFFSLLVRRAKSGKINNFGRRNDDRRLYTSLTEIGNERLFSHQKNECARRRKILWIIGILTVIFII